MARVTVFPGAVAIGDPITLPATEAAIDRISSVELRRHRLDLVAAAGGGAAVTASATGLEAAGAPMNDGGQTMNMLSVAAVATRTGDRTFTLNVATIAGDEVILNYIGVGEMVRVPAA